MKFINNIKTFSLTIGSLLALVVVSGSVTAAETNPFGMVNINHTYQVASNGSKCGEGKCGASKAKSSSAEAKCGASKAKSTEAKCGASKPKEQSSSKSNEGKCGGN